jgi:hypothetical protein
MLTARRTDEIMDGGWDFIEAGVIASSTPAAPVRAN